MIRKLSTPLLIAAMLAFFVFPVNTTHAANLTSLKDVMSILTDSAEANHTISFVAPSAVANNTSMTITFGTGWDLSDPIDEDDIDVAGSTEGELTTAADCTGAENAGVSVAGQVITIELCDTDGGDFTGSETITVEIGLHATSSGSGANQITNQTVAQNNTDPTIVVATASDSGTLATEIITDGDVTVTATVDPSVTFSITDTTVGFGPLDAAQECWAMGTAPASCNSTKQTAHTMSVGTNATGGVSLTYSGPSMTSGGDTINDGTMTDADGTPGTEEFGLGIDDNAATLTITAAYDENTDNYKFDSASDTTPIEIATSGGNPVTSTTMDTHYMANIAADTEAGSYSTDIIYVATGTF
ncbi:hypothetical protein ACFL04_00530 [Patescibacteria group bacterium]